MGRYKQSENPRYFAWVIAYVNSDFIESAEDDLRRYPEYNEIEAYIPTIKVLKKTHKGKRVFEDIPLLFNYGFFKIPRKYATSPSYLLEMKQNVRCIFSWVKDPRKVVGKKVVLKKTKKKRWAEFLDFNINVATATFSEVSHILNNMFEYSAHNAEDLTRVKKGDLIILKGYPFDGMDAEIVNIDFKKKEVDVNIKLFNSQNGIKAKVAFENVFFTVYNKKGYDDSVSTLQSLDEMTEKGKMDKIIFKNFKP